MITIDVFTLGNLPVFDVPEDEPGYWTERLSYELSFMLHEMGAAGMSVRQPEEVDFNLHQEALDGWLATFKTWVNAAFDRSNSRLLVQDFTEAVPSLITVGGTVAGAALSGGSSLLVPMLVNAGIQMLAHIVAGQANNLLSGASQDVSDVAEAIRESFLRSRNDEEAVSLLAHEVTDDNIQGVAQIFAQALLSVREEGEEVSIEALLQRLLEEWRVDIEGVEMREGKIRFQASQAVVPPIEE